eukprot:GHVH01004648.1.p1 GENE.GHVH01004648.1~~GHVH01004648.1.p1  ORF type:complete len:465 (+),score=65.11 GHVH01004648.1:120-1514(+)
MTDDKPRTSPRFQTETYRETLKKNQKIIAAATSASRRRGAPFNNSPQSKQSRATKSREEDIEFILNNYSHLDLVDDAVVDQNEAEISKSQTDEQKQQLKDELELYSNMKCPQVLKFQTGVNRFIRGLVLGPGTLMIPESGGGERLSMCLRVFFPSQREQFRYTCRKILELMKLDMVSTGASTARNHELHAALTFLTVNLPERVITYRKKTVPSVVGGLTVEASVPRLMTTSDNEHATSTSRDSLFNSDATMFADAVLPKEQREMEEVACEHVLNNISRIRWNLGRRCFQLLVDWKPEPSQAGKLMNYFDPSYHDEDKVLQWVAKDGEMCQKIEILKEYYNLGDRDERLSWRSPWNRYLKPPKRRKSGSLDEEQHDATDGPLGNELYEQVTSRDRTENSTDISNGHQDQSGEYSHEIHDQMARDEEIEQQERVEEEDVVDIIQSSKLDHIVTDNRDGDEERTNEI